MPKPEAPATADFVDFSRFRTGLSIPFPGVAEFGSAPREGCTAGVEGTTRPASLVACVRVVEGIDLSMTIPGDLLTTAMAVMPHRDIDRALDVALGLDVPFWPQLPHVSYYEDMYVQASEHFPGIVLDIEKRTLRFSHSRFLDEFEEALSRMEEPGFLDLSERYSAVYHRFLALPLSNRPAIRGQIEGPVSFGFNVTDEEGRPILFDDTVRPFLFEFMAAKANLQLARLKQVHPRAFLFVDEPGLQFLFSALSGYGDIAARSIQTANRPWRRLSSDFATYPGGSGSVSGWPDETVDLAFPGLLESGSPLKP